jgi:HSP20 family protein
MTKKPHDLISFPMHLSAELERLFNEIIHRPWGFCREIRGWSPSVDLYETDDAFFLEADLPGVRSEDVSVEVKNSDLVLQGWRSLEKNHQDGRFHTMERCSGQFIRHIALRESVDEAAIKLTFTEGVLQVVLPKSRGDSGEAR